MGRYLTSNFNEVPREQWSFGQVLEWHLVRGTRPGGRIDRPGRRWTRTEFADRTGLGPRTVGNWLTNDHLPPETETIERVLFGDDACYADWRLELRQAHTAGWAAKRDKPAAGNAASKNTGPPAATAASRAAGNTASGAATAGEAAVGAVDDSVAAAALRRQALRASNLPIRVPTHFSGREDELAAIDEAFARSPGRSAVVAVIGMRGIGKTTLAAAYAERRRDRYRATWWIRAHSEPLMRADLVALGVRLGWSHPEEREDLALSAVMERLIYENADVLLIYDNAIDADSLAAYLPRGGAARVLITSNFHAFRGLAEPLEINLWPEDTGAGYLITRTGRTDERGDARALSRALDGLPLAHEQAASYCDRLGIPLSEYLRRFEHQPNPFLDDSAHAPVGYHNRMTVARSFTLGIEEAAKIHPGAEPLIVGAALMPPEPIPLFLFAEAREAFDEPLRSALADGGLEQAVAALRSFALLKRETTADERDPQIATATIRLHRLVREVAAARRDAATQAALRRTVVAAMARLYPGEVFDDPATWPRARRLDEHARRLLASEVVPLEGIEEAASLLSDRLALYSQAALADYDAARRHHVRALAIRERAFGDGHHLTATTLHHFARVFLDLGNFAKALELYQRALAIREQVLGPDDLDTAATINNMAAVLQAQGTRFATVVSLNERALAIRERALGPDHPHTAASLINVARVLRDHGRFAQARPFAERGRAIRENKLGTGHPRTAAALNVLAQILQGEGDLAAAEPLFRQALRVCESVLGPDHPYTATTVTNLARLLQVHGDVAGAQALFERALAVRERVLGRVHPSTATSLNDLGNLYFDLRDAAKAKAMFAQALEVNENTLGADHPATAASLEGLARVSAHDGDVAEARRLVARAHDIRERALGPAHPATVAAREQLARAAGGADVAAVANVAKPAPTRGRGVRRRTAGPNPAIHE